MLKAVEIFANDIENECQENEEGAMDSRTEALMEYMCSQEPNITSIKCAAHTLQLAIKDFLCNMERDIVPRAREIVKALRTPTVRYWCFSLYFILV